MVSFPLPPIRSPQLTVTDTECLADDEGRERTECTAVHVRHVTAVNAFSCAGELPKRVKWCKVCFLFPCIYVCIFIHVYQYTEPAMTIEFLHFTARTSPWCFVWFVAGVAKELIHVNFTDSKILIRLQECPATRPTHFVCVRLWDRTKLQKLDQKDGFLQNI